MYKKKRKVPRICINKKLNIWDTINKFSEYTEGHIFKLHAFKKISDSEGGQFIFYDMEQAINIYGV